MSTKPQSADEFDTYIAKVARRSKFTGVVAFLGLLLVLGALVLSTRQLLGNQRRLSEIRGEVKANSAELARVKRELRSASDSLVRVREGFAAYNAVVKQQSPALAETAAEAARDSSSAARVVFIQFRGRVQSALVNELRVELNATGFNAPEIERVDRSYRNGTRYFHRQDQSAAQRLSRVASGFFAERGCPAEFPLQDFSRRGPTAPIGQMEIWINLNCGEAIQPD